MRFPFQVCCQACLRDVHSSGRGGCAPKNIASHNNKSEKRKTDTRKERRANETEEEMNYVKEINAKNDRKKSAGSIHAIKIQAKRNNKKRGQKNDERLKH